LYPFTEGSISNTITRGMLRSQTYSYNWFSLCRCRFLSACGCPSWRYKVSPPSYICLLVAVSYKQVCAMCLFRFFFPF